MHPVTESSLDPERLEKVRHHASGKITARCPACAEEGRDRSGQHLAIFPGGRFACAACPGDGEHRRRIFALCGNPLERPEKERESVWKTGGGQRSKKEANHRIWQARRNAQQEAQAQREALRQFARDHRQALISRHTWEPVDAWDDSPQRPDDARVELDPAHFLASLYQPADRLWTGQVHDSGKPGHARCWRPVTEWVRHGESGGSLGPMTTPAVWKHGVHARTAGNVLSAPYTVLDFDGFDGLQPQTPDELQAHLRASLALIRWLREEQRWTLAAILHTGGKSLHAWFRTPAPVVLASLTGAAEILGIDAGLIGRAEHPCRLPGQPHPKTGLLSRVLWLQLPAPPQEKPAPALAEEDEEPRATWHEPEPPDLFGRR